MNTYKEVCVYTSIYIYVYLCMERKILPNQRKSTIQTLDGDVDEDGPISHCNSAPSSAMQSSEIRPAVHVLTPYPLRGRCPQQG